MFLDYFSGLFRSASWVSKGQGIFVSSSSGSWGWNIGSVLFWEGLSTLPLRWISEPENVSVNVGDNISIECKASGSPLPKTEWEKMNQGFSLDKQKRYKSLNGILILNSVRVEDEGAYECSVENGLSPPLRKQIWIDVNDSPKIRKFSFQDNVLEGEMVSVTCLAATKITPISYSWNKDGKNLDDQKENIRFSNTNEVSVLIIDPVMIQDSGNYTCTATNSAGTDRYTSPLNVKASPQWLVQPSDIVTTLGNPISTQCFATGSPKPVIRWRKISDRVSEYGLKSKHVNESNSDNSFFKIYSVTYDDAGTYECEADNGIPPSIKANFTVTTRETPKIKKFSFEDNIKHGDVVSVTCLATSLVKPLKFQWQKNGQPISNNAESPRIEDGTSHSVLMYDSVQLSDVGNYTCTVKNKDGTDSFTAELTVKAPPKWLEEPENIVTRVGGAVSVRCKATGSPTPKITWIKLEDTSKPVMKNTDSTETFKIQSVDSADTGIYQCIADNGIPPNLKSNFTLTVRDAPKIRQFSFQENIVEGEAVSVMCFAVTKTKPIKFHWLKNGQALNEIQENIRFETGSEVSVLIIDPVKINDSGNYTCSATNKDGSDTYIASLVVKASPKFIEQPANVVAVTGATIESHCRASGSPQPEITWIKVTDTKAREESLHGISPEKGSSTLKISPVAHEDSGLYECVADNGIPPIIKSNFTLTVREPPKVKNFRFDDNIKEGDIASVTCLATSGIKPVKFQWLKNGHPITPSNSNVRIDDGAIHSVLVFDYVTLSDDGNYTCIAITSDGQGKFTAQLNVKASPKWKEEPKSVITEIRGSVSVNCLAYGSPKPIITWKKQTDTSEFVDLRPVSGNEIDFSSGKLNLVDVYETDAGFYECVADNGIPPSIRSNFSIIIREIPQIQAFSFQDNIQEGAIVSVTCLATTKIKPLTFQWFKNGTEIKSTEGNIRITSANELSVLVLDPVDLENSGNYTCSATNAAGSDKYTASLKVKASPKWIEQPTDTTTTVGGTVIVRCIASGSPDPRVSWKKKNGSKVIDVNFSQMTNDLRNSSILRISSVSYEDAGIYECIVDNGIPPPISSNFTLIIRDAPEIQKFSFQDDILEGKVISVMCLAVSKSKPINFVWLKNGLEISKPDKNVKIKNDSEFSVLIMDPVSLEDNANYTCKASNTFGSDQHTAYLNVKAPPKWLDIPKDIITTAGESVTISCFASGSPSPRIKFRKIADKIGISASLNSKFPAINETSNHLKISAVSFEDAGLYECTADNGISPKIKSNFSIFVRDPPILKEFKFEDNVKEGDFVSVTCIVKSGAQPINFIWHKNSEELMASNKDVSIENSPVTSVLILNSVSSVSDGNFSCTARNIFGTDRHSATLKVKASPKWLVEPKDVITVIGETVNVKCNASGSPKPRISWIKYSGKSLTSITYLNSSYSSTKATNLVLPRISYDDAGTYACIADNGIQPKIKANFSITIRESPIIEKFQFKENIKEGDFVSVLCIVKTGTQPISFLWYKNGEEFKATDKDVSIENSPISSILVMNAVASKSNGNYTCTAKNSFGSDRHSTTLKVKAPPVWLELPKNVTTVIGDAISIYCKASGSPDPRIFWKKYSGSDVLMEINTNSSYSRQNSTVLHISKVSSDDAGLYECIADNGIPPKVTSNFSITIHDVPKIKKFAFEDNVQEGDLASVICLAVSVSKPLSFSWSKNGAQIEEGRDDVRIDNSGEYSVLILDHVTLKSAGNYTCTVTNPFGTVSYTSQLDVKAPPKWLKVPESLVTTIGSSVNIECSASGSPTPKIKWIKPSDSNSSEYRTSEEAGTTKGNFSTGTLKILAVSYKDAGPYTCVADNNIGHNIKTNFTITIREVPEIQKFSFQDNIVEGKVVSVTCLAISDVKPLKFRWSKNSKILESGQENVRIEDSSEFSVLILNGVTIDSEGNYTCIATNSKGSTKHSAYLNVQAPPKWIETPDDMIKAVGEPINLKCIASGSPRPKIFWRKYFGSEMKRTDLTSSSTYVFDDINSSLKIHSLSYEDAGQYECFASNSVEPSISANFSITIRVKIEPFNFLRRFKVGERAQVTCFATVRTDDIQFLWFKDGQPVSESDNIRLKSSDEFSLIIIDPVEILSEGNYTCKASDSKSEASHSTQLQIDAPPSWLGETKDATVPIGAAITVHCRAHGSPKPEIHLRKVAGYMSSPTNQDSTFASNNGTFVFMQISSDDAGIYVCEANNGVGNPISKNFSIFVEAAPKIQPFSFKSGIRQGDKTTALCVAESKSPLIYTWKKDGDLITEKDELRLKTDEEFSVIIIEPVKMDHSGNYTCIAKNNQGSDSYTAELIVEGTVEDKEIVVGHGETLTFESLKITDAGIYICEAKNGVGPPLKKVIGLGIRDAPKVLPIVFPTNVRVGLPTKAFCTIEKGSRPLEFTWSFNGRVIHDTDSAVLIDINDDYSVLNINPVSSKHTGNYTCNVKNAFGRDSFTAALIVHEPTTWVKEPEDIEVLEGSSINLPCIATGLPKPSIRWYKYNNIHESAKNMSKTRIEVKSNGSLSIPKVSINDAGKYECEAENGLGSPLRKLVAVSVNVPARFEEKFAVVNAKKGDSARLKCEALGDQPLAVTWQRDETTISKSGDERYEIFETLAPKGVVSELIIRTTDRDDGALYSCVAENEFGNDQRKIRLLVMEVPAPPLDVKIREIWSRSASVSWAPPYSGNSPITKYIVQYWRDIGLKPSNPEAEINRNCRSQIKKKSNRKSPFIPPHQLDCIKHLSFGCSFWLPAKRANGDVTRMTSFTHWGVELSESVYVSTCVTDQ
ncbi:unnamed protein product [Larinioides sclopetarius]|uniref:Uncharacterized protein n=1 Tax=Larinioides sclopetarius TaxID=280406 RepID=A0AAV2ABC9_9ARAC